MQKTLIALAVAGLMSGAAFANTSVVIGGKYDAGYQFKNTANVDADTAACAKAQKDYKLAPCEGSSTSETLGDGGATSSRITVQATEDLAPGWQAMVDLDLRFGTIEEGKSVGTGGLSTNDKKALYLTSPFGNLRWGVMNLAPQQYWDYEEKPYMINVKDLEIVKYGISEKRHTSLTSRVTEYDTPILTTGPVQNRLKFSYAIGDSRKAASSDADGIASGDVFAVQETGAVGKWVNWGISAIHRANTNMDSKGVALSGAAGTGAGNGFHATENYINIHPVDGLKIGMNFNIYKGAGDTLSDNGLFKEKNTNFVVAYNFGTKAQIGIERSHLNDLSTQRNSGKGWMVGGSYFLSKSTYLYLAWQKDDYQHNTGTVNGGYDGTKAGFGGNFSKVDQKYTRFGIVKEF